MEQQALVVQYKNSFETVFPITSNGELNTSQIICDAIQKWWDDNKIFVSLLTGVDITKYNTPLVSIKDTYTRNTLIYEMYALAKTAYEIMKKHFKK